MTNQLSLGFVLDLPKSNKTIVFTANCSVSVSTPKGHSVLIEEALDDEGVNLLANGKIKFPKEGVFSALVTFDTKFKQVRVEPATPAAMKMAVAEAFAGVDTAAHLEKITAFFKALPEDGPFMNLVDRLTSTSSAPLHAFWADLTSKMAGADLMAAADEFVALVKAQKDKILPKSADDDEE